MPAVIWSLNLFLRGGRLLIPLAVVFLAGCATSPHNRSRSFDSSEIAFKQFDVVTGEASGQTVLIADFLGDAIKEVAIVHTDTNGEHRVRIYALQDDSWTTEADRSLSHDAQFVDVANIDGKDRLLTCGDGWVRWLDLDSGVERLAVDVNVEVSDASKRDVPRVDITRDFNGDGRDDLVLPDFDGFWISIQSTSGAFAAPVKLGPAEPFLDEIALADRGPYGEVGFANVDAGIADMFQAIISNSIDIDLHVYRAENGVHGDQPTFSRRIKPDDSVFGPRVPFFPVVLGGDFNGDGLVDLLVGENWNELHVFTGVHGLELFAREPAVVNVALPRNEQNVWLSDMNSDGKEDILLYHPSDTEPHRVILLIAQ